jgi:hypothetical protein
MKEKNIKIDAGTYNLMIHTVGAVNGDVDGVRRLFAEMKEKNINMTAGTYSVMIRAVGEIGGDVEGARRILAKIIYKMLRTTTRTFLTIKLYLSLCRRLFLNCEYFKPVVSVWSSSQMTVCLPRLSIFETTPCYLILSGHTIDTRVLHG